MANYPGATYKSVYEAGFSGFWTHHRLTALGIENIVVNPTDVPTTGSEKRRKTDAIDSGKLARSLRARELKGIYTPDEVSLEIRSLIRLENSIRKDMARQKNRIKSHLYLFGIEIPSGFAGKRSNWSKRFIPWLNGVQMRTPSGRKALDILIGQLLELRKTKLTLMRELRLLYKIEQIERFGEPLRLIMTVPSVGSDGFRCSQPNAEQREEGQWQR